MGYSPAALYEYFDSKEAIVQALSDEGDELLNSRLAEVSPDLPPGERLTALGLAYVAFARAYPEHFKLMFGELSTNRTSINDPVDEAKPYDYLSKTVLEGIEQGLFKTRPGYGAGEIAYGLWSLAHGAATLQGTKLRGYKEEFPPIDRSIFETFIKGLA